MGVRILVRARLLLWDWLLRVLLWSGLSKTWLWSWLLTVLLTWLRSGLRATLCWVIPPISLLVGMELAIACWAVSHRVSFPRMTA